MNIVHYNSINYESVIAARLAGAQGAQYIAVYWMFDGGDSHSDDHRERITHEPPGPGGLGGRL
jgi:hypothetical protein